MTEKPIIPNHEIPNSRHEKFLNLLMRPVPARKQVALRTKSEIMVDVSRNDMFNMFFTKERKLFELYNVERANRTGLNFSIIGIIRRPNCKIDELSLINKISGF